jgi:hypothetical protein
LINEPGLVGTIRTHTCSYGDQEPYNVAVLNVSDSPIAEGIELIDPQTASWHAVYSLLAPVTA